MISASLRAVRRSAFAHRLGQLAVDITIVALAYWLAFYFRFDGAALPKRFDRLFEETVLIVVALKISIFVVARFYTKWWRFTSVRDLQAIFVGTVIASLAITALFSVWRPDGVVEVPRGVLAFDFLFTLVMVGGVRFAVRSIIERPPLTDFLGGNSRSKQVLICGAGDAGNALLRELRSNRTSGITPIGLIDDDPRKLGLRVQGTRVLGGRNALPRVLKERRVDEVMIAMPTAPGAVMQEIVSICRTAGVKCTTLPGLPELIAGEVTVSQLREVRVEDVLGRAPVEIDFARAARFLNGKVVLVTGAGGSIGSELCRQIVGVGARRLVMVDHAENNLFEIDLELRERGHSGLVPVIADCRDAIAMERVFARERPQVVFHAAAYKHVPMMELNPVEAVANNALATQTLAETSSRHGVERFCLVSTDKAVEPKTVMGATKALAERVIEMHGAESRTRFAAVRFGNVLGSSGSVLPIFRRQIADGGPVTVTHPEMTRFFMTIPEAVQLVIEATGIADGGDIFVLDMGEPVKIVDLARKMIELSGHEPGVDIAIEVVGIRPGEKLHEELFNVDEDVSTTRYAKVQRATRRALDPEGLRTGIDELSGLVKARDAHGLQAALCSALRLGVPASDEASEPSRAG
ncbi:MAG: polysaccharide biosynthesis protein [Thermoleophilia bacterium]|nr:polysaccharide biosynthesis protein [Thermoleophilia bacterium]